MDKVDVTVAVTGMNATDNPAPGVAVARALRHEPTFEGRIIGLGYDALDPGFYGDGLVDSGAIDNPELIRVCEAVVGALRWRGPLEVEILQSTKTGEYFVIEINPRFPAWIHLTAGAGLNLPYFAVRLALGLPLPSPMPNYRAGTLFVRIAIDQITDLSTFEQLAATGVLRSERACIEKVSNA